MELALIGLGKMGLNMATRLVRGGHRVIGYARTKATVESAIQLGAEGAFSLEEVVGKLTTSPKIVWVMVPSGTTTTETIEKVASLLKKGDIIKGVVIKYNKHGALVSIKEGVAGLVHNSTFGGETKLREKLELGKNYNFQITLFEPKEHKMTLIHLE